MTSPWPQESYLQPGFAPGEDACAGWPSFAQRWYGSEYPAGRGQQEPERGWTCGCGRGYNPKVLQCRFCGPAEAAATGTVDCTWWPDAADPDES